MADNKIHLVCNAHLDPVWLWQRTEGIAETISTFRVAADFCEKYDNFVFNHNESVLYEWVEEHEPELFGRIKKLVAQGKWRIMGGWYLQPDVLMPCGESIIRQIKTGNDFFKKHFGYVPKTAINFDPFGHSRGLVQIMAKCGYENYVHFRPTELPFGPYIWEGYDGSRVNAVRPYDWYCTTKGRALDKIERFLSENPQCGLTCLTWGVGDHGGGPSEKDLNNINNYIENNKEYEFVHSDFDSYFNELDKSNLEVKKESLVHTLVGCYTSMVRIKQGHRRLENKLDICEKMICISGIDYDKKEFDKAEKALLFTEFHDVIPGSAVRKTEEESLRLVSYGEEILDRITAKAFFKLCSGQPKAKDGEIPVIIFNPLPYPVEGDFEVEFQIADPNNFGDEYNHIRVRDENGKIVPSQVEKEDCTIAFEWRKKVVFHAVLKPMGITRFDCEIEKEYVDKLTPFTIIKPYMENGTHIVLENKTTEIMINKKTGLVDKYCIDGVDMIKPGGIKIKAYKDFEDPWGMYVKEFNDYMGDFELISDEEANRYRGYPDENYSNVSVIENGDLRTKIQAIFKFSESYAVVTYTFSKETSYLDMDITILANDVNRMFKLSIDAEMKENATAKGQQMFGCEELGKDGKEVVFQKWCGLEDKNKGLYVLNEGCYGGSFDENTMNVNLLRTAVNAAHPNDINLPQAPHDRMLDHLDMGERNFKFRICANPEFVDYEAELFNRKPFVLSFFPPGMGEKPKQGFEIDNKKILLSAYRKEGDGELIRLFNSTEDVQKCTVKMNDTEFEAELSCYEVKTFIKCRSDVRETNILGE